MDPYEILGVSPDASDDDIRAAYRTLAQQWHPDKHQDDVAGATKKFQEINSAYTILADSEKRALFDDLGEIEPTQENELTRTAVRILAGMSLYVLDKPGDHLALLREMCDIDIAQQISAIQDAQLAIRKRLEHARLWRTKLGGRNIFANALRRDVLRLKKIIKDAKAEIEVTKECLAILAEYEFEQPRPPLRIRAATPGTSAG